MEFHEKLQELRKKKGLTQEELAEALYVSRTAISKWESGRGYPSIDSLKEISNYFDVTIDVLLSSEKLLSIAEKENKSNLRSLCDLLFGVVDLCSFTLVVFPLYPNVVSGYVQSVSLFSYTQVSPFVRIVFWILFVALILIGAIKVIGTRCSGEDPKKHLQVDETMTGISLALSIITVLFLALSREAYAIIIAFLLLVMKGLLLLKYRNNN